LATNVPYATFRRKVSQYLHSIPNPLHAESATARLCMLFGIRNLALEKIDVENHLLKGQFFTDMSTFRVAFRG
jgi:hypothetical protein